MANTYTQIYLHIIFSVRNKQRLLKKFYREELFKYIAGYVRNKKQKLIVVNGVDDLIHLVVSFNPDFKLSDFIKNLKVSSSKWINSKKFIKGKFEWQEGYSAFSYSKSQMNRLIRYVNNQEEHHKVKSYEEELKEILDKFDVDYNEKYLFG